MIGVYAGSYQIVAALGSGGMGAVYLGHHTILGKPAAIKVLLPELSQRREIVARFFNEARAATASRHPGIVEIYDFGYLPDGAAFIAMEFLEGESLAARLRRERRLATFATIQIGRQIAAALHAAHSKGITHRDLKPDNVFLVPDPEIGERVKLLDFGIAKLTTDDAPSSHTRTGQVIGTPAYMSPEQCRGDSTLDQRSDLYSLGCILYEALAGGPVFPVESTGDIIAHHLYFQPQPVCVHDPSLPAPLERLIMALLAKVPAQRPATAGVVVEVLDQWRTWNVPPSPAAALAASIASLPMARPGRISGPMSTTMRNAAAEVAAPPVRSKRLPWFAVTAAVVAAGAGAARFVVWPAPAKQPPVVAHAAALSAETPPPPPAASTAPPATNAPSPAAAVPPPAATAPPPAAAAARAAATAPSTAATAAPSAPTPPPPRAAAAPPVATAPVPAAVEPVAAARPPTAADLDVSAAQKKSPSGGKRATKAPPHGAEQAAASEPFATSDRARETPAVAPGPPAAPAPAVAPDPPAAPPPAGPAPQPAPAIPQPAPVHAGSFDAVSSIGRVDVDGPLPSSEIRRPVERALESFRGCYRSAASQASKTPALSVTLSFLVDEGGAANEVQVQVSDDALSGIRPCIKEAASRIRTRVAPDIGTASVRVVIKFQPAG